MTEPPRFTAPRGLGPLRLVAAIGLLASAAIATGGLASLLSSDSTPEPAPGESSSGLVSRTAKSDPTLEVELRVREAEAAAARARAALRGAALDPDERAAFEQRLDQLGTSPIESVRRDLAPRVDEREKNETRPHLRAIASPSREL